MTCLAVPVTPRVSHHMSAGGPLTSGGLGSSALQPAVPDMAACPPAPKARTGELVRVPLPSVALSHVTWSVTAVLLVLVVEFL